MATGKSNAGHAVTVIGYDADSNEIRTAFRDAASLDDRSRDLGIGEAGRIVRIDHGPLVAAEAELREASIASLAKAVADNYFGSEIYVDKSEPPVDEDFLDLDDRFHLDVRDGQLVALVTERTSGRPPQTESEIATSLGAIARAYDCVIASVAFMLSSGGSPDDLRIDFTGSGLEASHIEKLHAEQEDLVRSMPHDIHVTLAADDRLEVSTLLEGAAAMADYLAAIRGGALTAATIMDLLRGGHHRLLHGAAESSFLEVKSAPYLINASGDASTRAKIELAQDVARFANSDVDAVLILGFREKKSGNESVIARASPIALAMLDVTQHAAILDERIVPPVDGLRIERYALTETEGLLAIYVPKQPAELQPFLVHGAIAGDKVEGAFFSIVRRRGEGSITTSAQQIHAYIVAGKRYLRGKDHT